MLRSELISRLALEYAHLKHDDLEKIVAVILDEIAEALANGDRVELRGFGAFSVRERKPRVGRNPRYRWHGFRVPVRSLHRLHGSRLTLECGRDPVGGGTSRSCIGGWSS